MIKRFRFISLTIFLLISIIDAFVFVHLQSFVPIEQPVGIILFWSIPFLFVITLVRFSLSPDWSGNYEKMQRGIFAFFGAFILVYLPKIVLALFFLSEKLVKGLLTLISLPEASVSFIAYAGIIIAGLLFLVVLYGILYGKYHFKTEHLPLSFEQFPESWNGLRIVHITDLHLGSWSRNTRQLNKAVELINKQHPDFIFFTGDLVNNLAEEVRPFTGILNKLKARKGKYSILGNHDYGDYFPWYSQRNKEENLRNLKKMHEEIGFHLLLNESVQLKDATSSIGVIGVENWGLPPFHQYGDLNRALAQLNGSTDFNILLSHDPSHWKAEVINYQHIDLTLSGHTHGMQFGVFLNGWKWSPAKWKYPEWGGLYERARQKLYVNTGLGFIGFPGRVGVRPKISVLELYRK